MRRPCAPPFQLRDDSAIRGAGVSATGRKDFLSPEGVRVCPALTFLSTLV